MTDEQLQRLHDRATRGERLTAEEQDELDAWYARHDQAESQLLQRPTSPGSLASLQSQVATATSQLEVVTQHIREVIVENEHLRGEIAALQYQLARHVADHAA